MKKVFGGMFVILLFFFPLAATSSISSVNVIGNYETYESTPFYANLKEIYIAYLEEVVEPELKKKAKEGYWQDYLAVQPAGTEETENTEEENTEQNRNEKNEDEKEDTTQSKKAPDFKVKLISTMPNICYVSSYVITTYDEAKKDLNKVTLSQEDIYEFLDKVIEYKSEKKVEGGITTFVVEVQMKEIDALKDIFQTEEEKEIFQDSYELTKEVISKEEVIYERLYNVDANGNLVLSMEQSSGIEETDFSGLEVLTDVPYYCQWDNTWAKKSYGSGNIKSSGCGPTCCAMVVSYYTGKKVTPADIVDQIGNTYYVSGKGSSWGLFPGVSGMYGIKCTDLGKNITSVVEALRNGEIVIASMGPGTFTKGGHFIVLTGVTTDGKITVNDPSHPDFCSKTFETSVFVNEAKNYWKFSK